MQEKHELAFLFVSDKGNKVTHDYDLVFTLDSNLIPMYNNFGIDIPVFSGDASYELSIRVTYIIDRDGVIRYA